MTINYITPGPHHNKDLKEFRVGVYLELTPTDARVLITLAHFIEGDGFESSSYPEIVSAMGYLYDILADRGIDGYKMPKSESINADGRIITDTAVF